MNLSQTIISQIESEENARLTKLHGHLKKRKNKRNANQTAPRKAHGNSNHYKPLSDRISGPEFCRQLMKGEPNSFKDAITYLQSGIITFASKYSKQYILQILKHSSKTEKEKSLLRSIIFDRAKSHQNESFRYCCRLAIKISTPAFHQKVAQFAKRDDSPRNWKMHLLLEYLNTHCKNYS